MPDTYSLYPYQEKPLAQSDARCRCGHTTLENGSVTLTMVHVGANGIPESITLHSHRMCRTYR